MGFLSKSNLLTACNRLKVKENSLTVEVSELCEQLARPLLVPETFNVATSSPILAPVSWCSNAALYFSTIFSGIFSGGVFSGVYSGVMESIKNITTDFQSDEMKQLLWWSIWFGFPALILIGIIQKKKEKEKKDIMIILKKE